MTHSVTHYFSPMSGFAYLGIGELSAICARAGAVIEHRPVDISRVFTEAGAVAPARQTPARIAWRQMDMRRWALRRKLPFSDRPKFWPVDAKPAACAIIAAQETGNDVTAFAQHILAAVWSEDGDISQGETIINAARACGLDAEAILREAASPQAQTIYEQNTQDAIAAGVIGSPTYFLGSEMFFGQDRLDFLGAALGQKTSA